MGSNVLEIKSFNFPPEASMAEYAAKLDSQDPLKYFRDKFIIPTKKSLKQKQLQKPDLSDEKCVYFCGNSLGLQPKATSRYIAAHLDTWAAIGVHGHFTELQDSPLREWQSIARYTSSQSARLVGALADEVATMASLTVNLHLLMATFFKPTATRHKIILEWKAFPSDHYMIESQLRWHSFDPATSMILLEPNLGEEDYIISTETILKTIDEHATETALILLPGIQYYSGQLFDIETITKHAQAKGIVVGWDLAHAAGNVPLSLHDWNVDFAAWCTYKYMNAGPGAIAGLFVHERHSRVQHSPGTKRPIFINRLSGWYGGDEKSRFNMDNKFQPLAGAGGWQISNPSSVDLASLYAALSVFEGTSMAELRQKSLAMTTYLEYLLLDISAEKGPRPYWIITPSNPEARGAQLSIRLRSGLLPGIFQKLSDDGYVFDQRKPDVIRVAPVPLYNTFMEIWCFVRDFKNAVAAAVKES